ncbi:tRNA pseudouridine(55) synthase TruB [Rickettsia endosymbiont of Cardiosporidium cionae]|uniref:tRNA pseudouridine(55) synthase TruB n=1 Tax=Rickettsia endosymbiont of Cardiosporidium cionae TaxID=2777155 RepID=UPI001892E747|nr:tRNA pseudouridine(55) synthase TruB [Rickettsia endosymbiont of Cardiosporidium cionae]KAF8818474.1 tRNA pseudouridine(55) synthase TruB [Rickettsia endosymbiont of Cardiosporidium cionae]
MHGWLNIYKPRGISSAKLVAVIKNMLDVNKIGHTGTLDVEAEGVLPLACGEATKLVNIVINSRKQYIYKISLGIKTSTADASGEVLAKLDFVPSLKNCKSICSSYIGVIEQRPHSYSAIKLSGIRSYKLARANKVVEHNIRNVNIYQIRVMKYDANMKTVVYYVECSKGTYVRSLCEDMASSMLSLGFVSELQRIKVSIFSLYNIIDYSKLMKLDTVSAKKFLCDSLISIEKILYNIPVIDISQDFVQKIRFGQKCYFDIKQNCDTVWARYGDQVIAIGNIRDGVFSSSRVFNNY